MFSCTVLYKCKTLKNIKIQIKYHIADASFLQISNNLANGHKR